jgi:RimJ/RimL family protein N-acetyltransferase
MRLETERLVLRKPQLDDAAALEPLLRDPEVMRFLGGVTDEPAQDVIERWRQRWTANGVGHFFLRRRDDDSFVGRTGYVVWDTRVWRNTIVSEAEGHAQPELGWALVRGHWGRGYATEAARAVRDWGRSHAGVGHLISLIDPDNLASQRVAARLDCKVGGAVVLESGLPCDVWVHPE